LLRKLIKQRFVFLEIRPTDRTLKTTVSTSQLFIILHSLEKPHTWYEKFIGFKKQISYEIVSSKEEGIRYILRVPTEDTSSIKKTLLAYLPGIEIKNVSDYIDRLSFKIKTLKLQNNFIYPLSEQPNLSQHDPLAYLTAHLTKLNKNEQISIHFICSSVHETTHQSETKFIRTVKNRLLNNADIENLISHRKLNSLAYYVPNLIVFLILTPITFVSWLINNTENIFPIWLFAEVNTKSLKGTLKTDLYNSIANKLQQPLFETTIRIAVNTDDIHANSRIRGVIASFDTFSNSYQSINMKRALLEKLNLSLVKQYLHLLLKYRLTLGKSKMLLSATELSDLYHFPYTATTKTEDLLQVKSPKLPAPISLKRQAEQFDITFAQNKYGETSTTIGLTLEERRRHAYIIGATGTGKTTLLMHMIHQDIQKGNGLAIIDPHGDLAERLLGIIPEARIKDVVYFNPYDIEYPIGLNVLEIPTGLSDVELQREKDFITSTLISIFHKLYDAKYTGPRMEHILRNVILTALEQEKPTLFTIYDLLTNIKYRKKAVSLLQDEILKSFWKNEFEKLGSFQKAEQISPITNKLGRFLTTGMTRNILNQSEGKLDFEKIMNDRKILICNLSKGKIGEDTAYFLGGLLTAKIQLTALRRVHIAEEERKDFYLYIDEFQNFATMSFAQILSEARKYRLSVILAHQNTVQIENDLLETIIGNTGTIICFRTSSPMDENKLLPIFSPEVEKGQIANIPSYNFYMKINALQPQTTFSGEIENFIERIDKNRASTVLVNSRNQYGMVNIKNINTKTNNPKSTKLNLFEKIK
jgi:GTPase SAR1 family protein